MVKDKNWKEIRELLENAQDITLLQIIETGGQPEFHEILSLLMTGPLLYLVFINLMLGLNEQYEIIYTQEKGTVSPIKYHSILTIKETLLQLLTAISSTSLSSDKSSALILGTHKDQVSEEVIRRLENEIQRCKNFDIFLHKNVLKKFTIQQESRLLFPLDNKDGTQEELQLLRDALSETVHSHFQYQHHDIFIILLCVKFMRIQQAFVPLIRQSVLDLFWYFRRKYRNCSKALPQSFWYHPFLPRSSKSKWIGDM